jgi:hypothetical protein
LGKLLENNNLLHLWSNKNKKSPYNFSPSSKQKVWWTCFDSKHEDYYRSISDSHNYEFRCPECVRERDESFLQEKVRLYLETLGYEILHEHKCTIIPHNPKKKGKNNSMPFDNEIIIGNKHIIVEVMGEQHDNKIVGWHKTQAKKNNTTPEYELHYQKLKDRYKRIYAKLHGYEYLDIWYYEDDKGNELNDNIKDKINNFIDQIEKG